MAKSVSQLKNQARREEQRENWSRAIELYREAIRLSEEAGEVSLDLSLYNRIGDLYRRQGDVDQAVHYYMEAVDEYADQGLHTGAIALCNKIHRLAPDRVEVYRNLGRLYAATGLLAEARSNFQEYLERMEEAGEDGACRDARLELAQLTGDRELLYRTASRMAEAGGEEKETAVEVLLDLWDEAADPEEKDDLRRRLEEIAPGAVPDAGAATAEETEAAGSDGTEVPEDGDGEAPDEEAPAATSAGGDDEGEASTGDLSDVLLEAEGSEGLDTALPEEDGETEAPAEAPAGDAAPPEEDAGSGEDREAEPGEQGYVDLGDRIRRRLEAEGVSGGEDAGEPSSDYDFDDMLVGFRVQVDETEGEADPAAHLELGVALRQMGLLDDAVREFQVAARSPEPPLRAFELLGEAFIEKGLHGVAVRVLTRALHLPGHSDHELLGVLYQLGIAHQTEADHERALDCFERVYSVDIDFRDVAERMEAVRLEL